MKRQPYKFMFAAYLGGMFVDMVEAVDLSEAKRLFKYLGVSFDHAERV